MDSGQKGLVKHNFYDLLRIYQGLYQETGLIFLEFSKALGKVNHFSYSINYTSMASKTAQYTGSNFFLIVRPQSVLDNGDKSDEVSITSGVLVPHLYILYI
jgi:cyclophilin family peptidyl-prolyl cis-trans isomerase